jgi:genome maintenance exonuclease 1
MSKVNFLSNNNIKKFNHLIGETFDDLSARTTDIGRFYTTPDGKIFPSVTTVTGWEKRKFFAEWREKNAEESRKILARGNALHETIEDYLNNKEDFLEDVPMDAKMLFNQMKPLLHNIDTIHAQEVPLYSTKLMLAGRVDCVAEYKGVKSIIDFKSSKRAKRESDIENYFAQATAYSCMWQEMTNEKINQIVILVSASDGTTQEFISKPMQYVPTLKRMIDLYWKDCNPFMD